MPKQSDGSSPLTAEKRYEQICKNITECDEISFKLLGLVPVVTGSTIFVIFLKGEVKLSPIIIFISLFGSIVTFGVFRWELRNIQTCKWLRERAAEIETKEFGLEKGQFAGRQDSPKFLGFPIGKTEAEEIIYIATIIAWLVLAGVAALSYYLR